jgi:hypothetical protein
MMVIVFSLFTLGTASALNNPPPGVECILSKYDALTGVVLDIILCPTCDGLNSTTASLLCDQDLAPNYTW